MSGELTVWVDQNRADALRDIVADVRGETGVKVDLVVKQNEKIRDDFTAQVPTGKGPDITIGAHDWLGAFVQDGLVAPIELGDKAGEFQDVAISAFTYDDKVYGLPYAIENIALMRNTDLAPEAPATFDDMIAAGHRGRHEVPVRRRASTRRTPTRTTCTASRRRSATRSSRRTRTGRTTGRS